MTERNPYDVSAARKGAPSNLNAHVGTSRNWLTELVELRARVQELEVELESARLDSERLDNLERLLLADQWTRIDCEIDCVPYIGACYAPNGYVTVRDALDSLPYTAPTGAKE